VIFDKSGYLSSPFEKKKGGVGGISGLDYGYIIKIIFFAYLAINTVLFEINRFIFLLRREAEIPLAPFDKGGNYYL